MIDYGLISLFLVQGMLTLIAAVVYTRLLAHLASAKERERDLKERANSLADTQKAIEARWERHRVKVKESLEKRLDYELAHDKLRTEIRRVNARLSNAIKEIRREDGEDELLNANPGGDYYPAPGPAPDRPPAPVTNNHIPPGFGGVAKGED